MRFSVAVLGSRSMIVHVYRRHHRDRLFHTNAVDINLYAHKETEDGFLKEDVILMNLQSDLTLCYAKFIKVE